MKRTVKVLLPIAVLLIGVALAMLLVQARPEVDRQPTTSLPPLVRVIEVEPRELALTVRSQGSVEPLIESTIVAQVAGRIDWIAPSFAEGGFFERGDTLVRIDPRDYELAVSQAEAQVAQAEVRLKLEKAEAELAREEWKELGGSEPNSLALREPQLAEAKALVQAAQAALEKAQLELERTRIRAQFDGRIRSKLVDLGQFVSRGTPVASVYSTRAAEIRLPVSQDDLVFVGLDPSRRWAGEAALQPDVLLKATIGRSEYSWSGKIVRTGSEFDPKTRMLPLFARIEDPLRRRSDADGQPLPMGLFVNAEIAGIRLQNVIVVPRSALRDDSTLLIVDADSRLRLRQVDVVRTDRDHAIIEYGLAPGDRVCVSQLETVVEGMLVRTQLEDALSLTDSEEEARL